MFGFMAYYMKQGLSISGLLIAGISSVLRYFSSRQIQYLNANEFEKQIIAANSEQLIDVCTPREFEKYHIPNAKNIDFRSRDFRKQIEALDKTKPVLIYCLSGVRSKLTAMMFHNAGFKTIYDLDKGLEGWMKAGKPKV